MMSAEQNDFITRVGPGRPAGELLRRYWQPAALADEFATNRPIRPVRLLGEDLVMFRTEDGGYSLMDRHCPHRGADLCFGRLEQGGLRCAFHGWLFGPDGQCLEQPAEPERSTYHTQIKNKTYPCVERNGIVFAYMGPLDEGREPPPFPDLDCFVAPNEKTFAFKGHMDCNWLQALEVGIDPAHASFLHRFLEDEDTAESYGKQFRAGADASEIPLTRILREYPRPEITVEKTAYGLRITSIRALEDGSHHVRVTNQVFPHAIVIPMSSDMTITQWHVPIDDETCYWYAIFTSFGESVNKDLMRKQRLELYQMPDYIPRRNRANNYGFDAHEQATKTYTGMGMDINVHDQWAVESLGQIQDRTQEHLGNTDIAIARYRRMLRAAITSATDGGDNLPLVVSEDEAKTIRGPVAIDAIGTGDDWRDCWIERDAQRRRKSGWAPDPWE